MASVALELFKKHVNADDFSGDDAYLQVTLDSAEEAVVMATNDTRENLIAKGSDGNSMPLPLQRAILMLAAHWYNQRESVAGQQMHEVPSATLALIKPYRILKRGDDL